MITQVLILIAGLVMIVYGADFLVEGASAAARKLGVSEFVIGLTIVGMGTSAPEMVVSFIGALQGKADIAVGNIIGSNIFNTLLILGVSALIFPMTITRGNRRRDIPINFLVILLMAVLGMKHTLGYGPENGLTRIDGAILLCCFVIYIWSCFKFDAKDTVDSDGKQMSTAKAVLFIIAGLAGLIIGGRFFVNSATSIAAMLGISEKFVAITILAGGTSIPELATCVVAAVKKKGQLALGNILGSNVFNVLLILGGSALINPLSFADISLVDLGVVILSAVLVWMSVFTGKKDKLDRFDGTLMILVWLSYLIYLLINL
ncbi:MAG: calcium/sodium antiporter [Bacteroidales bacterium]|nr:calcium/sodium antiporter [Bacteroidales bacterium]